MTDFIQKLLDDIHNINPELALKRQTEYNQNFVNKVLNEQCDVPSVKKTSKNRVHTLVHTDNWGNELWVWDWIF